MIRDATTAGLLTEQPLGARLDNLVEAASTASLDTLDDGEKVTAQLYLQNAAQAADEEWQQIVPGPQWPNGHEPNPSPRSMRTTETKSPTSLLGKGRLKRTLT